MPVPNLAGHGHSRVFCLSEAFVAAEPTISKGRVLLLRLLKPPAITRVSRGKDAKQVDLVKALLSALALTNLNPHHGAPISKKQVPAAMSQANTRVPFGRIAMPTPPLSPEGGRGVAFTHSAISAQTSSTPIVELAMSDSLVPAGQSLAVAINSARSPKHIVAT